MNDWDLNRKPEYHVYREDDQDLDDLDVVLGLAVATTLTLLGLALLSAPWWGVWLAALGYAPMVGWIIREVAK